MILAVDVGNSTTRYGVFRGRRCVAELALPTHPEVSRQLMPRQVCRVETRRALRGVRQVVICSVVPRVTARVVSALRSLTRAPIRVVGKDVKVPIENRYRDPNQVGQDRLVGAYAAWRRYQRDCIVADFGTAITIDVVRGRRPRRRGLSAAGAAEYLGGVIIPGVEISLEALAERTALLPRVTLKPPRGVLGRDTPSSIRAGLLYGYGALCDGLVAQLARRYAPGAFVVATGGHAGLMARYSTRIRHVRPRLVLEGLCALSA